MKEITETELEHFAQEQGGKIYNHLWDDWQGLRKVIFDESYIYNGEVVNPDEIGAYDLWWIVAGWAESCRERSDQNSIEQAKILDQLGIPNLQSKEQIATLPKPIMVYTGRRGGVRGSKAYGLRNNKQKYTYYSSTESYRTNKEDVLFNITFFQPTYRGKERIADEGTMGYSLCRLGPALLREISTW